MENLSIITKKPKQILDITDILYKILQKNKWKQGLLHLFVKHTSCAITAADLDPGTDLDMIDAFEEIIPKLKYRHPHDPSHVGDHIMSSIIGSNVTVPVEDFKLLLGNWQRVVLVELNGPRERNIVVSFVGI